MNVREATDADWEQILPILREVVDDATYGWPPDITDDVGTVPQAFDDPEHGLVGLHVMHRFLA